MEEECKCDLEKEGHNEACPLRAALQPPKGRRKKYRATDQGAADGFGQSTVRLILRQVQKEADEDCAMVKMFKEAKEYRQMRRR